MRRIAVTYSTMGQSGSSHPALSGGYRYRGDENWPQDRSAYEPDAPRAKLDGGPGSTARKQKRLDDFAAALADLGADPRTATPTAVIEAGLRVGVGYETARGYRNELRKRQTHDGKVRDA